jgi:diguanylate cyclase (GGDEF)-like protein
MTQLFAHQPMALYLLNPETQIFELATHIGEATMFLPTVTNDMCWALQGARVFLCEDAQTSVQCQHINPADVADLADLADTNNRNYPYLCIQLVTRGETFGLLHLRNGPLEPEEEYERWERKAVMVADRLALSFSNITLREQLHEQSIRDPLTNLFNRRYLNEIFKRELSRSQRENLSIGIILIDIDHFKQYNDTYGHEGGDVLLRNLGAFLQEHVRAEDVACRFGGEEFILVLPGSSLQITHERAWTLCRQVRYITAEHDDRQLGHITLSAGVACFPNHGKTVEQLIMVVDDALYRAKRLGRDRVCVAGQE